MAKHILRADLKTIVPLLIKSGYTHASINLNLRKATESDSLDVKKECGSMIIEIMLAIDDSIYERATTSDSEIAKLTKVCLDRLTSGGIANMGLFL